MKLLEAIIISTLVFLVIYLQETPIADDLNDFQYYVVVDKKTYPIIGNMITIKSQFDDFKNVRCYDIVFIKYNIGDTIK